jgi:hypothetical protein
MILPEGWTLTNWIQWSLVTAALLFVLNVLFESNVRHFLEERGWDQFLSRFVRKMRPFTERRGFWFAFGLVVGGAIVSWGLPLTTVPQKQTASAPPDQREEQKTTEKKLSEEKTPAPITSSSKKDECIKTNVEPRYLMSLYENKLTDQGDRLFGPFIGQCMHIKGTIYDIRTIQQLEILPDTMATIARPSSVVTVPLELNALKLIVLLFDKEWAGKLSVLTQNQNIAAFCRIKNASSNHLQLEHCELENQ